MANKQSGFLRGDLIGLLIAAVLLGGLLIYGATTGQELPLWPSLLVIAVNLVSAGYVLLGIVRRKRQSSQSHTKL
ncbi:MAG: hypothetical protein K9K38_15580 [Rhodoferax sp.]|nr:hypothetical protein [Rhodoferax sp.]